MSKLKLLNSFEVEDYSSSCGELEYVVAKVTNSDLERLYTAGFSKEQVKNALGDYPDEMLLDLSMLALDVLGEFYWSISTGFTKEPIDEI